LRCLGVGSGFVFDEFVHHPCDAIPLLFGAGGEDDEIDGLDMVEALERIAAE